MFNVLIVEDDKNLRKLIVTCLKKNNYNTYEATNGEDALEILDKNFTDLIITDIMMPKMDGFELVKELRESKYNIPILLITAKSDIEDKKMRFYARCRRLYGKTNRYRRINTKSTSIIKKSSNNK